MITKTAAMLAAIVLLMAAVLTGCGGNSGQSGETQTATEAATQNKYTDTDVTQPEWTLISIPVYLKDNAYIYATKDGFKCFAFVGTDDSDAELLFMFTDETAELLRNQSEDNRYYISIGEEEMHIGDVTLNDDCTIASLKGQHSFEEMTSIASRIRGL